MIGTKTAKGNHRKNKEREGTSPRSVVIVSTNLHLKEGWEPEVSAANWGPAAAKGGRQLVGRADGSW